jgi:general secretion pathway protein B
MSYILDALRRAENERERDRHQVPDLHAAHAPLPQAADAWARANQGTGMRTSQRWLGGLLVLVLALAAAAAAGIWFWGGASNRQPNKLDGATGARATAAAQADGSPASTRGAAPAAVPPGMVAQIDGPPVPAKAAAEANARALEAAALPAANADRPLTAPAPRGAREPARAAATPNAGADAARSALAQTPREANQGAGGPGAAEGAGVAASGGPNGGSHGVPNGVPNGALNGGRDAGPDAAASPAIRLPPNAAAARPGASVTPAAATAPAPVVPLNALAPELRSQIPPMVVGGAIHSNNPANRFVLINGQVVREGESAATGVTLERIGPKSAVMRWRDMRFEMPL